METLAAGGFAVHKTVLRIASERLVSGGLPEALAETLLRLPQPQSVEAWAIVCLGRTCLPPVTSVKALQAAIAGDASA
jgi:hypothetical protein